MRPEGHHNPKDHVVLYGPRYKAILSYSGIENQALGKTG